MEQKDEREYLGDFEGVEWELRILRKRKIYQRIWVRGQGNLGFGCVGCGRALEGRWCSDINHLRSPIYLNPICGSLELEMCFQAQQSHNNNSSFERIQWPPTLLLLRCLKSSYLASLTMESLSNPRLARAARLNS